jgi:hypothetical protein
MLMATLLARMPDLRDRVQATHVPDHTGHCVDCGNDTAWPCELYQIATEAEYIEMQQPAWDSRRPDGYPGDDADGRLTPLFQPLQPHRVS